MSEEIYAPIIEETFTLQDALAQVTKIALSQNKLKRGIRQVSKSILRNKSKLVILSESIEKIQKEILIGLAKKNKVTVIFYDNLDNISNLFKMKISGVAKGPKCLAMSVEDFVRKSEGKVFLDRMIRQGEIKQE